ncbi:MAG TPA: hypothetical protein VGA79_05470, partial [Desulfobaccales bacterium]
KEFGHQLSGQEMMGDDARPDFDFPDLAHHRKGVFVDLFAAEKTFQKQLALFGFRWSITCLIALMVP